jgi:hypothetical protein
MLSSVLTSTPHTSALQVCLATWRLQIGLVLVSIVRCLEDSVALGFELTHSGSIVGMAALPVFFVLLCLFGGRGLIQ